MSFRRYEKYRPSRVVWLGDMPEHWDVKKLKHLADVLLSNVDKHTVEGQQTVNLCNYVDVYKNERITSSIEFMQATASEEQIKRLTVFRGDVIITKDSEDPSDIGVPALIAEDIPRLVCGYHLAIVRPTSATGEFLQYLFRSNVIRSVFEVEATGMTRYALSKYSIENLTFAVPDLLEQSVIAGFLDREISIIDALTAEQRKLISLLKDKRQAIIAHAVTKGLYPDEAMKDSEVAWLGEVPMHWGIKKIKYLFEIKKRISGDVGYEVLSITQQGIKVKDTESGDGQLSMDYSKYQFVEIGDFAMNHMDLLTGYVDISSVYGVTSPDYRVFSVRDNNFCHGKYYLYLFQMGYKNKIFFAFGQGSSQLGRWRFPTEQFNNFYFPFPSIEEQVEIASYLDRETGKIDALMAEAERAITLLQERRSALISAAVTGKIDVREMN